MTNAKRVLLLVTQADWGGVQSFLIHFATDLKKEGCDVLLAAGGDGELWKRAVDAGIATHRLQWMRRDISPFADLMAFFEIRRLIKTFQPDAIHLNSSKMGVIGSLAAHISLHRPSIVYRIGGWSFLEPMARWKQWTYRTAEILTAKFKDTIITVHPGDEALARRRHILPKKNLLTVPNGLDLNVFDQQLLDRATARQRLGIPMETFVIGTVANAYATKGLLPYLDALAPILKTSPSTKAVIIGDGPELEDLKHKRDRLGLTNHIIFTGHRDDAMSLYRAFDLFVLPSRKEGMPWTLLEAMAARNPIIATDVGACRWMLQHLDLQPAGIIVPPQDTSALTTAIQQLQKDSEQQNRLGHMAREAVEKRFCWQQTFDGNKNALFTSSR